MKDQQVLGDDWRGWLRKIGVEIRGSKERMVPHYLGSRRVVGDDSPVFGGGRRLTFDEWGRIQDIIRKHDLICVPRNACMGFGCAVTIYEESEPICVGVPPQPERLIDITQDQLPGASEEHGPRFEAAWAMFAPFIERNGNKERAKREGLGDIREKSHYDY